MPLPLRRRPVPGRHAAAAWVLSLALGGCAAGGHGGNHGSSQAGAPPDGRQHVDMPAPMVAHMLSNMRDHLQALTTIQRALGEGRYQQAADVAEQRLGLSSLDDHGAAHIAAYMPAAMQAAGTGMHQAASRFALAAQDAGASGRVGPAVAALADVTAQCVACHAAYRVH